MTGGKQEAAGVCGGRVYLWNLNGVILDNGTLNFDFCT
jgi:hypothetical protein